VTVTVKFSGPVRRPWPEASREVELESGSSVARLLTAIGFDRHEQGYLQVARNGVAVPLDALLSGGDEVDVMLRVGGG
jgi:sulfur carrier protein ThiS